ncbi:uncharacterized protein PGTG_16325 [Puccinia graminis f. sp. tritici CRL 75-36-700-3]|uniref:DNA-directed RNA polymerase n=1 Tax=Puccinia graminis f. sp. tritici (strain CRL 75-36-700-3 / race SCCL) TaxID=418459 RepID=E3L1A4_PUCGT|nr:uncharacterized protein PGTG_16325 [Puccinia graminis f. sp. tritici CRL 75-36-700-3]EFP90299.1 hypothetical protein PGTG_16325 [Puccinia graminis f. sp. tritici CRL 75-36-700-3]
MNKVVAERLDLDPENTHPKNGAYLVHGLPLMRTRDLPKQAHWFHGLEKFYKALEKLGQVVPIPENLNQIGDNICWGLLNFVEKKELGKDGLQWLKINLSNNYGNNKASLDDWAKFIEEQLELVIDSADQPLEGNLVPGKKPGDVYLKVAIKVSKLLDFNTTNGHDIAKALKGHIKRKVV